MATVTALNNFMQAPWPTIAGPNIFDSKIEPVEDMASDRVFPCCVVYTDYDKDHWNKGSRVHGPRLLTVTLELLIVQATKIDTNGNLPTYALDYPVTDSEIENSLDFMEAQIFRALTNDSLSAEVFNYICGDYVNVVSRRGASVEGGQRLAARQITLEMKANRDPVAKVIPDQIDRYLTRLETFSDFAERVPEIRAFMTEDANASDSEITARTFGYTSKVLDAIGSPRVPVANVLPPQIVYLNSTGGPLP
jgi:hypothetical protein